MGSSWRKSIHMQTIVSRCILQVPYRGLSLAPKVPERRPGSPPDSVAVAVLRKPPPNAADRRGCRNDSDGAQATDGAHSPTISRRARSFSRHSLLDLQLGVG